MAITLCACELTDVRRQTLLEYSLGEVSGSVMLATGRDGPVYARVFRQGRSDAEWVYQEQQVTSPTGDYRFTLLPGTYLVGAYQDLNRDGNFQRDTEPWEYDRAAGGTPTPFIITQHVKLRLPELTISSVIAPPVLHVTDGRLAILRNLGKVVTLDDPSFNAGNAALGLWRPFDFLAQVGGGLFMLQEYRSDLTPVLFIHGMNGNPTNWRAEIDALDRTRFQPWVAFYPSGLDLDLLSDYFDHAVDALEARHGFKQLVVVAHSTGGLVARSWVLEHTNGAHPGAVSLLLTVSSPVAGLETALRGVEFSPLVVAAWRDLAEDSEFIKRLLAARWPSAVDYQLVFTYLPGNDGDGVVTMRSQLPQQLQQQATHLYGFEASHTGVLSDSHFLGRFKKTLASVAR